MYQKSGRFHLMNGIANQDVLLHAESGTAEAILVADGVSACSMSRRGADVACRAVSDILLHETEYLFGCEKEKLKGLLTAYVFGELRLEAEKTKKAVEEYASTLCFACRNKLSDEVMTFTLGDSLVYTVKNGRLLLAGSPVLTGSSTTYTTTTPQSARYADISISRLSGDEKFLVASDGAWRSFYSGGVLSEDIKTAVQNDSIVSFLKNRQCNDDCSIAILDIRQGD